MVKQETLDLLKDKPPHSLSKFSHDEHLAIQELKNKDSEIVIKPADKGDAIVIQNMSDYKEEAFRQLNDELFYRKLRADPTLDFQKKISDVTSRALELKWISKNEYDFLNCKHPVTTVFYMLPKIHKSLVKPKGRPIIARNDSLFEPLSNYVDYFLKPYVQKLPSYIQYLLI